jgi:hypothetical protein
VVLDEPFYACYLSATGIDHPMREEILASQPTRWADVVEQISAPLPERANVQYQKHMTHHMVSDLDEAWLQGVTHAFLVRDPQDMVASYVRKRGSVTPEDLGLRRQVAVYESVCATTGQRPPVLEARDVLRAPETALRALCEQLELAFSERMLKWPGGVRESDGVWANHWYNAVAQSTGFGTYTHHTAELPDQYQAVANACRKHYEFFLERKSIHIDET